MKEILKKKRYKFEGDGENDEQGIGQRFGGRKQKGRGRGENRKELVGSEGGSGKENRMELVGSE
jgi:hypothetical protein